jgi:hypothetical protein
MFKYKYKYGPGENMKNLAMIGFLTFALSLALAPLARAENELAAGSLGCIVGGLTGSVVGGVAGAVMKNPKATDRGVVIGAGVGCVALGALAAHAVGDEPTEADLQEQNNSSPQD